MDWKQQTIIRILLLVAKWLADDSSVKEEIRTLSNHITARSVSNG